MFKALQLKLPTECKQEKLSSIVQNAKYLDSRQHKKKFGQILSYQQRKIVIESKKWAVFNSHISNK